MTGLEKLNKIIHLSIVFEMDRTWNNLNQLLSKCQNSPKMHQTLTDKTKKAKIHKLENTFRDRNFPLKLEKNWKLKSRRVICTVRRLQTPVIRT